jgi:hypothetical protein
MRTALLWLWVVAMLGLATAGVCGSFWCGISAALLFVGVEMLLPVRADGGDRR